jgi:hypothetical protein
VTAHFITMVIKQPSDPRARQLMHNQLTHVIGLYGGGVARLSLEDEMTLCERLQERLPDHEVMQARKEVAALHAELSRKPRKRAEGALKA